MPPMQRRGVKWIVFGVAALGLSVLSSTGVWGAEMGTTANDGLIPNGGFETPVNDGQPDFPDASGWRVFGACEDIRVIHQSNVHMPPAAQGAQWGIFKEPAKRTAAGGVTSEVLGAAEAGTTYVIRLTLGRNLAPGTLPLDNLQVLLQVSPDFSADDWKGQNFPATPFDPKALLGDANRIRHELRITVGGEANDRPVTGQELRLILRAESDADPEDEQILVDAVSAFKVVE